MRVVHQILLLSFLTKLVLASTDKGTNLIDADGSSQSSVLLLTVIDLLREVKDLHCFVKEHSEKIDKRMDELEFKFSQHVDTIGGLESRLVQNMEDIEETLIGNMGEMDSVVKSVGSKIDVWRSEVRLISHHKQTWQNSTHGRLFSDFVVDGVYTLSDDYAGANPIQHVNDRNVNTMIIIDLGGLFQIHLIKVWNRMDCCQDRLGVLIYADDELVGNIHVAQVQYNFYVKEYVFARKIYFKQVSETYMNYLEIQVFGNGPYEAKEAEGLKVNGKRN